MKIDGNQHQGMDAALPHDAQEVDVIHVVRTRVGTIYTEILTLHSQAKLPRHAIYPGSSQIHCWLVKRYHRETPQSKPIKISRTDLRLTKVGNLLHYDVNLSGFV